MTTSNQGEQPDLRRVVEEQEQGGATEDKLQPRQQQGGQQAQGGDPNLERMVQEQEQGGTTADRLQPRQQQSQS